MADDPKLKITFKADDLQAFIARYIVDVSDGGMFIRLRDPYPVESKLRFDFQLRGGQPLFQGFGTVVWARSSDPDPIVQPGMGLRFDALTTESLERFKEVLAARARLEFPHPAGEAPASP